VATEDAARRPLEGQRVLVTRAREQAAPLIEALRALGAEPLQVPLIAVAPAADYSGLDAALRDLARYGWAIFTSANTVAQVELRLAQLSLGWSEFGRVRVAAIGRKTAGELERRGVAVAYVPTESVGTALAAGLPLQAGERVLLAAADIADPRLLDGLQVRGAWVDAFVAYRTVAQRDGASDLRAWFVAGEIDVVTFASSSAARNLIDALGEDAAQLLRGVVVACIGPVTAEAARACGVEPAVVAAEHTIEGLVAALAAYVSARSR
jgi:uroporphyrinogen III methyltransferase/synthase